MIDNEHQNDDGGENQARISASKCFAELTRTRCESFTIKRTAYLLHCLRNTYIFMYVSSGQ